MASKEITELKKAVEELKKEVERLKTIDAIGKYIPMPYPVYPRPWYPNYPIYWQINTAGTTIDNSAISGTTTYKSVPSTFTNVRAIQG